MVSRQHRPGFSEWSGLGLTICVCITSLMIVDLFHDIFSCGTRVFMYVLVHVMCLCVYVNMVCQRCMLYDDMYSHNTFDIDNKKQNNQVVSKACHLKTSTSNHINTYAQQKVEEFDIGIKNVA